MSKVLTGILAAALMWVGYPVPGRGEARAQQRIGLDLGRRFDTAAVAAADGSRPFAMEAPASGQWLGVRFQLAGSGWSSALEVASLNLGVWSISHFLLRDPWSFISEETIRRNFETGLVWDGDGLLMNCLLHPGHGSTYFNVARSSGLSFWESVPFALAGSAMWEGCMENEAPSRNDLVFTTCGGVYLGEIFHRLSSRILDGRTRGLERVGREFAAFVLNPAGGLHRLFRGDMFRTLPAGTEAGRPFETRCVVGQTRAENEPFVALNVRSGDPLDGQDGLEAFDYFVHRSQFSFGTSLSFVQSGYGYLAGTRLGQESAPNHLVGLFLHFDLRKAEAVRLGASSLAAGLVSKFRLGRGARLETAVQVGATLLGAFDNPRFRKAPLSDRDYNFGSGALAKAEAALDLGRWGTLRTNYARHYLAVLDGTPGIDRASFLEAGYEIPVYRTWSIGVEVVEVQRDSNYKNAPDVRASDTDVRLILGVRL